jgi:hypothetical protein
MLRCSSCGRILAPDNQTGICASCAARSQRVVAPEAKSKEQIIAEYERSNPVRHPAWTDVSIGQLVPFFLRAWIAWLIASIIIAIPFAVIALMVWIV